MISRKSRPSPKAIYSSANGTMYWGSAEEFLKSRIDKKYKGKIQLLFTSPPFPLNRKKKYGNFRGKPYLDWLASFALAFREMLAKNGSIVLELGNAWEPGRPVMSTLALEPLLVLK